MYNKKDDINKDSLLKDENFLDDATSFLIERGGYDADDLMSAEDVYDGYMEHFRFQNVNEVTAINDMIYAQNADDVGKERMARLMDTYDKMDSDLGLDAAGDYIAGVFSAPSTYAGLFTGGGAKVGAMAAQQGVKLGIRQALKGNVAQKAFRNAMNVGAAVTEKTARGAALREAAKKGAIRAGAVEGVIGAGQVAAQEQTRVETGMQEDISGARVGIGAVAGMAPGALLGAASQVQKAVSSNAAERVVGLTAKKKAQLVKRANQTTVRETFEDEATKVDAEEAFETLQATKKAALDETVPDLLEEGMELKQKLSPGSVAVTDVKGKPVMPLTAQLDDTVHQNISAAVAKLVKNFPPETLPNGTQERISSRMARAMLAAGREGRDDLNAIADQHGITVEQLVSFMVADTSQAGRILGYKSAAAQAERKAMLKVMDDLDKSIVGMSDVLALPRQQLREAEDIVGKANKKKGLRDVYTNLNKARIGLMTVQLATTVRNVSNGYLRNYMYAFDNLGSGMYNKLMAERVAKKKFKRAGFEPTEAEIKEEALRATKLGNAQLKVGFDSLIAKDLLTITTGETAALTALMKNPAFGKNPQAQRLFMEMADVADHADLDSGAIRLARKLNYLNTMSDNMFKRAIFARELDKTIRANSGKVLEVDGNVMRFANSEAFENFKKTDAGQRFKSTDFLGLEDAPVMGLNDVLKKGRFYAVDNKIIASAMEEALDFTYQTANFKNREGNFNSGAQWFIDVAQQPFASTFVPFPRYMVNQLRFFYEHTPILGMINIGGILNKSGNKIVRPDGTAIREGTKDFLDLNIFNMDPDTFGKQVGGLAALTGFYALRSIYGDDTTGPFEYKDPAGSGLVDAQAALGPFSVHAVIADLIYKNRDKLLPEFIAGEDAPEAPVNTVSIQDFIKAAGGGQFRGTGLDIFDNVIEAAQSFSDSGESDLAFSEYMVKYLGNVFNSFTVGAGVLKDVVATLDPDYRVVPDNSDVNLFSYFFKQATRSMPRSVTGDEDAFFFGREKMGSPTREGGIRIVNPFMRQLTGLTPQETRNLAEVEFDRLGLEWTEITPRKIKFDQPMSNEQRAIMGQYVENNIIDFINRDSDYKNAPDVVKVKLIREQLSEAKANARARILNTDAYMGSPESQNRIARAIYFNKIPKKDRDIISYYYKSKIGKDLGDTGDYLQALQIAEDQGLYGGN